MGSKFLLSVALLPAMSVVWFSGCNNQESPRNNAASEPSASSPADDHGTHNGEHADAREHADDHAHGDHDAMQMRVDELASYGSAMQHIEQLRTEVANLIETNQLLDVHPAAEEISLVARRLPELASKSDIPRENWKAINTQSRELANLFGEIDAAADAKKKTETEVAFDRMGMLIDELKEFAP